MPAVRSAIWSIDKDQAIVRVATMTQRLEASAARRRLALLLFEAFAIVAMFLAAIGTYSLLSGDVAERTDEIGVRCALGATRPSIFALILRQGMKLAGLGIAFGTIGAMFSSRALVVLLFEVSRLDSITYLGVIALLAGVSALACAWPAWRAAHLRPYVALRRHD
jgi:putative ABC transport system permease protein